MNRQIIEPDVTLRVAYEDPDSVVKLIGELVRIPSRAGTDPCGPMLERMSTWLAGHGMVPRRLPAPGGETVTMVCEIYMMAACGGS